MREQSSSGWGDFCQEGLRAQVIISITMYATAAKIFFLSSSVEYLIKLSFIILCVPCVHTLDCFEECCLVFCINIKQVHAVDLMELQKVGVYLPRNLRQLQIGKKLGLNCVKLWSSLDETI